LRGLAPAGWTMGLCFVGNPAFWFLARRWGGSGGGEAPSQPGPHGGGPMYQTAYRPRRWRVLRGRGGCVATEQLARRRRFGRIVPPATPRPTGRFYPVMPRQPAERSEALRASASRFPARPYQAGRCRSGERAVDPAGRVIVLSPNRQSGRMAAKRSSARSASSAAMAQRRFCRGQLRRVLERREASDPTCERGLERRVELTCGGCA